MANYSPKEMAVFLRRCGNEICDDSCPCAGMDGDCCGALMRMGSEVLDETTEKLDAMRLLVEKHLTKTSGARPLGMPPKAEEESGGVPRALTLRNAECKMLNAKWKEV